MSKRKFILKTKEDMSDKNIEKLNRKLGEDCFNNVVLGENKK